MSIPRSRHATLPPIGDSLAVEPREEFATDQQIRLMRELRDATNAIADQFRARDELLLAITETGALSRREIGIAAGLAESRVNQVARELAADPDRDTRDISAAAQRVEDALWPPAN